MVFMIHVALILSLSPPVTLCAHTRTSEHSHYCSCSGDRSGISPNPLGTNIVVSVSHTYFFCPVRPPLYGVLVRGPASAWR